MITYNSIEDARSKFVIPKLSNSNITISTPENKTYSEPMRGYYPATYGFENDADGSDPTEWLILNENPDVQVISELDGHNKVLRLYDNVGGSGNPTRLSNNFTDMDYGTVEVWIQQDDLGSTDDRGQITGMADGSILFGIRMWGGSPATWKATDNASIVDIIGASKPVVNTWYHIRIDFEHTIGGYHGLGQNEYFAYIDGVRYGPYAFNIDGQLDELHLHTYSYGEGYNVYFDAVGYSWDVNYNIGDNLEEGLLLSFETGFTPDWVGYSLNSMSNKTILGNSSIPFPDNGIYTIQLFGNNSVGNMYNSAVRYFTVDYHDLSVSIEVPSNPEVGGSYLVNATVINNGLNDEYDVGLFLYLNGITVTSIHISSLLIGENETISYVWNPPNYGKYNFTVYSPPTSEETFIINNFATKILSIVDVKLFDGMCTNYSFKYEPFFDLFNVSFSYLSEGKFEGHMCSNLDVIGLVNYTYVVQANNRIMSNFSGDWEPFLEESHDPSWVFTIINLGDEVPIAIFGNEEHIFKVTDDFIYILADYGFVEVWELRDLTVPSCYAWYEKSTGLLLHGKFIHTSGEYYVLDFIDTNIEFDYYVVPSLNITIPNSIITWEPDTSQDITWNSTGTFSNVKIELYENNQFVMEIIANTPNDRSYTWSIPSGLHISTQYQIKITDVLNPATYDFSEYFEIYTFIIGSFTLINPDSLTIWEVNTSHDITWISTATNSIVKIELYNDDVLVMEIVSETFNDGSYSWNIPLILEDSTLYQIKILDVSNTSIYDYSDYFEIKKPPSGGPSVIPGYELSLLIGLICIISVILLKKKMRN